MEREEVVSFRLTFSIIVKLGFNNFRTEYHPLLQKEKELESLVR